RGRVAQAERPPRPVGPVLPEFDQGDRPAGHAPRPDAPAGVTPRRVAVVEQRLLDPLHLRPLAADQGFHLDPADRPLRRQAVLLVVGRSRLVGGVLLRTRLLRRVRRGGRHDQEGYGQQTGPGQKRSVRHGLTSLPESRLPRHHLPITRRAVKWGSFGLRLSGAFAAVQTTASPSFTSRPPWVARTQAYCQAAFSAVPTASSIRTASGSVPWT